MNLTCRLFGHRFTVKLSKTEVEAGGSLTDSSDGIMYSTLYDYGCVRCGKPISVQLDKEEDENEDEEIEKQIKRLNLNRS
jgi:DNA-directed RNA polymerase subunit RPC12/RpoP